MMAAADGIIRRLRQAGWSPRRRLGQHILHDPRTLERIAGAAGIEPTDCILEVGTGPGTLTRILCDRAARVISVELDSWMVDFARGELEGRTQLTLIHGDILGPRGEIAAGVVQELSRAGPFKLVANLPYGIATPLLLELFSSGLEITLAVATVQREVAERLAAAPGSKTYGPAGLLLGYWAEVEPLWVLPPGAFQPPPQVTSRVIRIRPRPRPLGSAAEYAGFRLWVDRLFGRRRKQVGGILRQVLGEEKALEAIQSMAIQPRARAETLPPLAFLELARNFPGNCPKV